MLSGLAALVRTVSSHPANREKRLRTLAKALRFEAEARLLHREWTIPYGQARLVADVKHYSSVLPLQGTPPDQPFMDFWTNRLKAGDTFVDVGANVGVYSLWIAQRGVRCIAVEPDPSALWALRRNLALNPGLNIEVMAKALSDQAGKVQMTGGDVLNSIAGSGDDPSVEAITVDELVGRTTVAGMKIDVEGAERLVLVGAAVALREKRILALQIEWNDMAAKNFRESRDLVSDILRFNDYSLFRLQAGVLVAHDGSLGEDLGEDDVIALPR